MRPAESTEPQNGGDTPGFSTVTVTYNSDGFLDEHLKGVALLDGLEQALYIDNGSNDGTVASLQAVPDERFEVTLSPDNSGFSKGCNTLLQRVTSTYTLFLNPDVLVHDPRTVRTLIEMMEVDRKVGVAGCALFQSSGEFDHAAKRGEPTLLRSAGYFLGVDQRLAKWKQFTGYTAAHVAVDEIAQVDAINGAFMLMPTSLARQLGGFDETFWMYGEDLDLCRRVRENGRTVLFAGSVRATHLKGAANNGRRPWRARVAFAESMFIYRLKHGTRFERAAHRHLDQLASLRRRAGRSKG